MKPIVMISMLAIAMTPSAAMADTATATAPTLPVIKQTTPTTKQTLPGAANLPNVSPANSDLINRGAYIARAADCVACHGEDYTGGTAIETPMGAIYATNITPSKRYGIGNYTLQDLTKVLRKGRAPDHRLYPAMPYASYTGMSDEDIEALFAYLQTVPAVDMPAGYETDLPFPFNIRSLMAGWNLLNVPANENRSGLNTVQQRGEYLVNNLEHCGTCHTPRNATMGFDKDRYLSGAPLGQWYAPNITPDEGSGIGSWSESDIVTYLRTGELDGRAYAGGPMGEAVSHSTRYLTDDDLGAIASYLKAVPAVETDNKVNTVDTSRLPRPVSESITHDLLEQKDYIAQAKANVSAGNDSPEALYLAACASCHGVDGYAQPDARYAPIVGLTSLRRDTPDAVINIIAHGIDGATNTSPNMPGFANDLSDEQIAGITDYVRVNFGGLSESQTSAADVDRVINAEGEQSFLIKYASVLAWLGVIVVVLLIGWLIWYLVRRTNRNY